MLNIEDLSRIKVFRFPKSDHGHTLRCSHTYAQKCDRGHTLNNRMRSLRNVTVVTTWKVQSENQKM
ncbi:MAG: hypothetical protein DCO98_11800 [Altererythrobacter sp. XM-24bin4]|nr:MAG: hypothetical protein DCO98_11800 [Altererythrobacter sp. XM-24bin4]